MPHLLGLRRRIVHGQVGRRVLLTEGERFLAETRATEPPSRVLFLEEHFSFLWLSSLGRGRALGADQATVQDTFLQRLPALLPAEESVLRVRPVPDQRLGDLGNGLSSVIALLEVADILVDQSGLLLPLVSILEHLGVLSDLDVELVVIVLALVPRC